MRCAPFRDDKGPDWCLRTHDAPEIQNRLHHQTKRTSPSPRPPLHDTQTPVRGYLWSEDMSDGVFYQQQKPGDDNMDESLFSILDRYQFHKARYTRPDCSVSPDDEQMACTDTQKASRRWSVQRSVDDNAVSEFAKQIYSLDVKISLTTACGLCRRDEKQAWTVHRDTDVE